MENLSLRNDLRNSAGLKETRKQYDEDDGKKTQQAQQRFLV